MKYSMTYKLFRFLTMAILFALPGYARGVDLTLFGVYAQNTPTLLNTTSNATFAQGTGLGGGLQINAQAYKSFGIELGAFYTTRGWSDTVTGNLSMPAIDFPVGLTFSPFSFFSFDAGGYYSSINSGSKVYYIGSSDYGAYGGAQIKIAYKPQSAVVVGARYLYGLENVSSAGGQLTFHSSEILLGWQISFGEGGGATSSGPSVKRYAK